MPNVESKIVVNIRAVVDGLPEVKELSASINALNKKTGSRLAGDLKNVEKGFLGVGTAGRTVLNSVFLPFTAAGKILSGVISSVVRQLQFMAAALALTIASSPALLFGLLIKEGLQFNSIMEQQKIGLAALIQSTQEIFKIGAENKPLQGLEAFNAATAIADSATQALRIKIIPLKATSEQLLPIFNQIVVAGAAAGLTLNQTQDTFVSLAAAAQILQVPIDRLGTEIRLFLGGVTRETSRLGPALFGTAAAARAFVKEHRASGDLFDALQIKLAAYNQALIKSEQSFGTLAENTKEVFQLLAGLATRGLFEKIKEGLTLITQGFFDLHAGKLKPEFEALFNFINDALTKVGSFLVDLIERAIGLLRDVATYVQNNGEYVSAILGDIVNIAEQLIGIVTDVLSLVTDLEHARGETASWHVILGGAAITIGTIRDLVNIVVGLFQVLGSVVLDTVLTALEGIASVLALISDTANSAVDRLRQARQGLHDFAESGAVRFASGITFENGGNAAEKFLNGNPNISTKKTQTNTGNQFGTRLQKFPQNPDDKNAAKRLEDRIGQLKQQTERLLRQLADERISTERADNDRLFTIQKSADEVRLSQLKDSLGHQLVSVQDYYAAKQKLDDANLDRETKHLKDQFNFDKQIINNKLTEINERFKAAAAEPKNSDSRIQAELARQKEAEELIEINNFKQKELKLNEDLALIDQKRLRTQEENSLALSDSLAKVSETNAQNQASLLEQQGRQTDAEIRRIALQYRDTLKEVLVNTNPATDALKEVITSIDQLGSVTSQELLSMLRDAGIEFDSLSEDTKALIKLMQQLENQAAFKGFQTGVQIRGGQLDLQKAKIQDEITRGVISERDGRLQVADAERKARVELEKFIAKMEALPGLTEEEKLAIQQLKFETSQLGREMDVVGNEINSVVSNDLGNFFNSILEGNKSIGESFRTLLSGLLIDIAKVIFQAIILKAILGALGLNKQGTAGAGSAGGIGGVLSGIFGFNEGGEAGQVRGPGTGTSDSILARISNGEFIVKAASVRRVGVGLLHSINDGTFFNAFKKFAAGGPVGKGSDTVSGFTGFRNVNVLDPDLLAGYLTSSAGEHVFLNVISRNPQKVRRALGI